jgi:hypothetical protein
VFQVTVVAVEAAVLLRLLAVMEFLVEVLVAVIAP